MTPAEITALLPWGQPERVPTSKGERLLHRVRLKDNNPQHAAFRARWAAEAISLRAAGVTVREWPKGSGRLEACLWRHLDGDTLAAEERAREASRAVDAEIYIPAPEGLNYLGFQRAGIAWSLDRFKNTQTRGVFIADEMGLGKTIQAIGCINATPEIQRVLVICPATLKWNWFKELSKWLVQKRTIGVAEGKCFPSTDIVIINFDILHNFERSLSYFWDLVIIDECHYLVNKSTRRARCVFGYRPRKKEDAKKARSGIPCRRKIAMTGTPLVNRPAELYPILHWLDPITWPDEWRFKTRYCDAHRNNFGWDCSGASNMAELQDKLRATCMIRRLKKDVLKDLPPKLRKIVEITRDAMDAETRQAVDAELALWNKDQENLAASYKAVAVAKASANPLDYKLAVAKLRECLKVKFTEMAAERYRVAMATVPHAIAYLRQLEEDDPTHKVVTFVHHRDVAAALKAEWPNAAMVVGGMDPRVRMANVERFQSDPKCTRFFGSIRAAAEGITLTAASHVVFVEEDWTPGKTCQAEDRCHRIGQRDSVLVEHLVLAGSLAAKVLRTTLAKQEIFDQILDTDPRKAEAAAEIVAPEGMAVAVEAGATRAQARLALA